MKENYEAKASVKNGKARNDKNLSRKLLLSWLDSA